MPDLHGQRVVIAPMRAHRVMQPDVERDINPGEIVFRVGGEGGRCTFAFPPYPDWGTWETDLDVFERCTEEPGA